MKIKFLMAGLLGLVSATTFAQKGELNNAKEAYEKYEALKASPLGKPSIIEAKASIDKASTNEKTASLPLTFAVKGAVYAALAVADTVPATSLPLFSTSADALKKAKELDTKGENAATIKSAEADLAQYKLTEGVSEFQNKAYDKAYSSFDFSRSVFPDDTTMIYYTGLSASYASEKDPKFLPLAITNYNKLLTTKYTRLASIYIELSSLYLTQKDTTAALKAVDDGIVKYPTNGDLRRRSIEISLQSGKISDVLAKIQGAIANDPKNKTLYYYEGLTYSQVAQTADDDSKAAKDEATKNKLYQKALDNYSKSADVYKKALEIDPNYFDANLNLGYVIMKPGINMYNDAGKLPANKQKEYDAAVAKAMAQFDLAKPYLQKAVDLNPKSKDALTNLMSYYRAKKDNANAAKLKAQIDALN